MVLMHPGARSPGARHGPQASRGTVPGGEAWSSCIPGHGPRVRGMVLWGESLRALPGHGPRVRGMVLMHPGARSPGARHGPLWRSLIALSVGRGPRAFVFGGSRAVGHDCKVASVRSVIATRLMHRACACIPIGSAGGVSRWSATGRAGRELRSVGRGGPACASPSLDLLPPHRYDFHF